MADGGAGSEIGSGHAGGGGGGVRGPNRSAEPLPTSKIVSLMLKASPDCARITGEAMDAMADCATKFVSYVTSEANKCLSDGRVKLTGDDLISTMDKLGFSDYVEPLKLYLEKYREEVRKLSAKRKRVSEEGGYGSGALSDPGTRIESEASEKHLMKTFNDLQCELQRRDLQK